MIKFKSPFSAFIPKKSLFIPEKGGLGWLDRFKKYQGPHPTICFLTFTPDFNFLFHSNDFYTEFRGGPLSILSQKNRHFAWGKLTPGASGSVFLLEEIATLPFALFVCFGSGAALSKNINSGQFYPIWGAFRQEGTSFHYQPPGEKMDCFQNLISIDPVESKLKLPPPLSKSFASLTTDAPYRETLPQITYFWKKGARFIDMECSALMAWSAFHQKPLLNFLTPSDYLLPKGWFRLKRDSTFQAKLKNQFNEILPSLFNLLPILAGTP